MAVLLGYTYKYDREHVPYEASQVFVTKTHAHLLKAEKQSPDANDVFSILGQ